MKEDYFQNIEVISNLNNFISSADLIIANRLSRDLSHVQSKVYSRDLFREN